jgi:hypothetical protein
MIQPSAPIAQNEQTTRATPGRGSGSSACILKPVSWLDKTLPQTSVSEDEVNSIKRCIQLQSKGFCIIFRHQG